MGADSRRGGRFTRGGVGSAADAIDPEQRKLHERRGRLALRGRRSDQADAPRGRSPRPSAADAVQSWSRTGEASSGSGARRAILERGASARRGRVDDRHHRQHRSHGEPRSDQADGSRIQLVRGRPVDRAFLASIRRGATGRFVAHPVRCAAPPVSTVRSFTRNGAYALSMRMRAPKTAASSRASCPPGMLSLA